MITSGLFVVSSPDTLSKSTLPTLLLILNDGWEAALAGIIPGLAALVKIRQTDTTLRLHSLDVARTFVLLWYGARRD